MSKFVQILRSVSFPLGRVGVGLLLLALTACHTTSQAPLDDAYYWPDKSASTTTKTSNPTSLPTGEGQGGASSSIEYTNVQDTTVTIKIKR